MELESSEKFASETSNLEQPQDNGKEYEETFQDLKYSQAGEAESNTDSKQAVDEKIALETSNLEQPQDDDEDCEETVKEKKYSQTEEAESNMDSDQAVNEKIVLETSNSEQPQDDGKECEDTVKEKNDSQTEQAKSNLDSNQAVNEFQLMGIEGALLKGIEDMKWEAPTFIQREAIPHILAGKDVTIASETGSGKTGAFALPILARLQQQLQGIYALVLEPTRELADQVAEQFESLGRHFGVTTCTVVGHNDRATQVLELATLPNIIVATPGRIHDIIKNTSLKLQTLKVLVLDEADKMLQMNFEEDLHFLLRAVPAQIQAVLVSATLSKKVTRLQSMSLQDPVILHFDYKMPEGLRHFYYLTPVVDRETYLVALLSHFRKLRQRTLVFTNVCTRSLQINFMLINLGFRSYCINGKLPQKKRNLVLEAYQKDPKPSILVATEVASRGLDFKDIHAVINFDLPWDPQDYTHRAGRTARAGKTGVVISLVHQYNVQNFLKIEKVLLKGEKQPEYPLLMRHKAIMNKWELKVAEAKKLANKKVTSILEILENNKEKKKRKPEGLFDNETVETEDGTVVRNRVVKKQKKH